MKGVILILEYFFYVPKVTYDIRMVFDEILSRLNDYLRDRNLMLQSMGSLLMMVVPKTHMVNLSVGEIFFINFEFLRYWKSIAEWIWDLIWGIRSTGKEHIYRCAGSTS